MIGVNTHFYIEEQKEKGRECISLNELIARLEELGYELFLDKRGIAKVDKIKNCDGNTIKAISATVMEIDTGISAFSTERTNINFSTFQKLRDDVCVVFDKYVVGF